MLIRCEHYPLHMQIAHHTPTDAFLLLIAENLAINQKSEIFPYDLLYGTEQKASSP